MELIKSIGFGYQPRCSYACDPSNSLGRLFLENESTTRTIFQRDRDRIIHSTAFRRLKHKTQVFISHEGDHYRTRLTHSIEVAQIARSMARAFCLDEDLTEAIALVHDFGHTPFGHAGERVLNELMREHGGFDHNAQSLRIVTKLEQRYPYFDGLNLSWETLEGLVKHNGPVLEPSQPILDFDALFPLNLKSFASLEAQAAAIADDIAYDSHDIDDGLRASILNFDELRTAPLIGDIIVDIERDYTNLSRPRMIAEITRRQITKMVEDVMKQTAHNLERLHPQTTDDIRHAGHALVTFSPHMARLEKELKDFLFKKLYRHNHVVEKMRVAGGLIEDLFHFYIKNPHELPENWCEKNDLDVRKICDFLSGMTDQFAIREHQRLFDSSYTSL
jgi:dGTPase